MSDDQGIDVEQLAELSQAVGEKVTELKRAVVEDDDEDDLLELADDLWEVLGEVEELLETIDFQEIPEAIDFEDLPETVDVNDVPEGLLDEDESAIELTNVREAVQLRELWDAVDLTQLREEKRELDEAVDDATDGDGGLFGDDEGDDGLIGDDDGVFGNVVDVGEGAHAELDAEARQAYIEEMIIEAVEAFRSALLTAHEKLRKLYRANQEKLGQPGRQPDSLNPTATSTMPPGPIPDSASSRASTVPSQVRYSRAENPRRIYGRRFARETAESGSEDEGDVENRDEAADVENRDEAADVENRDEAADVENRDEAADVESSTEGAGEGNGAAIEREEHDD